MRTHTELLLGGALALVALATVAPTAVANVPAAVTRVNALHIPALNNATDGSLSTTLSYATTTATATSTTGNTIWLGTGNVFKLTSCIAYHVYGAAPVSSCADRVVDTTANSATIYTSAPSVALFNQARPSGSQRFGYFTADVQVLYQAASGWTLVSHSWPDDGLRGAGLAVAAQDAATATLPPNGSFTVTGTYNGAINSGQPDSICRGAYRPSNGSPLPAGVSTSNAAFAGAPAYYEIGQPSGTYLGRARRGTMLVIHGGSWITNGPGAVESERGEADRWRARGFQPVSITCRPCGLSAKDVGWFYDRTRAAVGAAERICADGISAGGYLALLLATWRPDVYCVVSRAGPTDLASAPGQPAYDTATATFGQFNGGRWLFNIGSAAFGPENVWPQSPVANVAGPLKATRVLQGFSADDPLVPWGQATELRDAMLAAAPDAYSDVLQLPKGTVRFGHGYVTQAALEDLYAREVQLVAPIGG